MHSRKRHALVVLVALAACNRAEPPAPHSARDAAPPPAAPDAATPVGLEDPSLPGIDRPSATLDARLAAALKAKDGDYAPRTHHFDAAGRPKYTNRLVGESSPYLLQHAHNPVNWFPWGEAAFARAQAINRPVLLSVGYSTCHWCHVMERESFEDEEIAAFINRHFVAIKVDREERPDVDDLYMRAVRMLSRGNGGWPMTVVMTPDRRPFFGGTYFPARKGDRGAQAGFIDILRDLEKRYRENPEALVEKAAQVSARLQAMAQPRPPGEVPGAEALERAAHAFARRYEPVHGGFGRRPKFPRPSAPKFMLQYHRRTGDPAALQMVRHTLEKMARGGLFDQVGGGFHRYSVDDRWLVPHFEKMLYDQAQLVDVYLDAWQVTGDAFFAEVVRRTLDYLLREMTDPAGGFWSATDADSQTPEGHSEEGWYFTWTPGELRAALGSEAARVVGAWYGVTDAGNFEGRNILHTPRPAAEVAAELGMSVAELAGAVEAARPKLRAARAKRPPPLTDTKVLAAWNGLTIGALARAGLLLDEPRYVNAATRAADFVLARMRGPEGLLRRTWRDGQLGPIAYLDDLAFLGEGLLHLFEATGAPRWLDAVIALHERLDAAHLDATHGGYFTSATEHEALLAREKPDYDGAEPSGNAVAARNLVRLAELTGDEGWRRKADRLFAAFATGLGRSGVAMPRMLGALDARLDVPRQVVLLRPAGGDDDALRPTTSRAFLPNRALLRVEAGAHQAALRPRVPLVEAKTALKGRVTAYVCERGRCERPTTDAKVLAEQLARVTPLYPDRAPAPLPSP